MTRRYYILAGMKRLLIILLALAAFAAWRDWSQREVIHPPGIVVPERPRQEMLAAVEPLDLGGYQLTRRARFQIRARVLSRENYRWDGEADLAPVDLALGWGVMSDQAVLDRIEISQGSRWYFTRYELPAPIPDREIVDAANSLQATMRRNASRCSVGPKSSSQRATCWRSASGSVVISSPIARSLSENCLYSGTRRRGQKLGKTVWSARKANRLRSAGGRPHEFRQVLQDVGQRCRLAQDMALGIVDTKRLQ